MTKLPLIASLVLSLTACAADTEPGDAGPSFLKFGANTMALKNTTDRLVITAALSDPDGIDDLVGGTLSRADTGVLLGAFATSAAEGAYSLELDAMRLLGDTKVPRTRGANVTISLTAEFYDQAGHTASQSLDVTFGCEAEKIYVDGQCVEIEFDVHDVSDTDACYQISSNLDSDITCGSLCPELDLQVAPWQPAAEHLTSDNDCYCGPCSVPEL